MVDGQIEFHPISRLFPLLGEDELKLVADDIKATDQGNRCLFAMERSLTVVTATWVAGSQALSLDSRDAGTPHRQPSHALTG
jgi:hypothetical protein